MNFGVILGSGLDKADIFFSVDNIFKSESSGVHNKKIFTAFNKSGVKILFFSGRKHYYEGHDKNVLTENINFAKENGIRYLLITNAAGGINRYFRIGDIMLITSYISLNPLLNTNKRNIVSNSDFQNLIIKTALLQKVKLQQGVYGYLTGPAYETNAEISMLRKIGIDSAGMSTVPELSKSTEYNIQTAGISIITNLLRENSKQSPEHSSVLKAASDTSDKVFSIINLLANELKNC